MLKQLFLLLFFSVFSSSFLMGAAGLGGDIEAVLAAARPPEGPEELSDILALPSRIREIEAVNVFGNEERPKLVILDLCDLFVLRMNPRVMVSTGAPGQSHVFPMRTKAIQLTPRYNFDEIFTKIGAYSGKTLVLLNTAQRDEEGIREAYKEALKPLVTRKISSAWEKVFGENLAKVEDRLSLRGAIFDDGLIFGCPRDWPSIMGVGAMLLNSGKFSSLVTVSSSKRWNQNMLKIGQYLNEGVAPSLYIFALPGSSR